MSSYGSSSPSASTPAPLYGTPPPTLPNHGAATTNLITRPDVVTLTFALRAVVEDPDVGVALLEQSVKKLEPRFADVAPKGSMKLRMRGTLVERAPHAHGKIVKATKARSEAAAEPEPFAVSLQGTFEYALAATQDYWSRSHEIARIAGLASSVTAAGRAEEAAFTTSFGGPELHVQNPEAFRAELVQRWAARKRQSGRDVKSGEVAVTPESCRLAGDISEHVLSMEEIELSLPVDCRPSTSTTPTRPGGPPSLTPPITE